MTKRSFRLTLFGMLYFVQGAGLAYFRNFQKPYLDSLNVDPDVIGLLTSILLLPFVLKIFIGMLSDRVNLIGMGHRKPYMMLGLVLAAASFFAAGRVDPSHNLSLFAVLVVLGSFSVTLFDSTADGLAIDITPVKERGTVQGTMVGGRAAGFILLSLVFGAIIGRQAHLGYQVVFTVIAIAMLLPLLWVWRIREPDKAPAQSFNWGAFKCMGQPRFLVFAAYAVIYSIASFGVDGLVTFFMSDHFEAAETLIGQYGALRGLGAVIGAIGGGLLVDRLGRSSSAYLGTLAISIGAVLIGLATKTSGLLVLGLVWGIAWGFQETIFVALAMDLADSRIAASMFAIMMALSNLGTSVGDGVATALTDNFSFSTVFMALAAINLIVFPILWLLFRVAPEIRTAQLEPAEKVA